MKTKRLKIGLALATATLTTFLFNNFSFTSWHKKAPVATFEMVNEASRIAHAKELLGGEYKGSDAQRLEGKNALSEKIHAKVVSSLAPKWKSHARAITKTVITESAKYQLDPVFVLAVIKTESKFDPAVIGRHGEIGLMQIKPDTAEWIATKFNIPWQGKKTLENPASNIRIGLAYMQYLRSEFKGKATKYVSAYNMGPRNVRRLIAQNVKPAEYNSRVMKNYNDMYAKISADSGSMIASN